MTTEVETYITRADSNVTDLLIWRRYHRDTGDLLERTLDFNYGLCDYGIIVPSGVRIDIPIEKPVDRKQLNLIKLWD